jgi:hypothetical protein
MLVKRWIVHLSWMAGAGLLLASCGGHSDSLHSVTGAARTSLAQVPVARLILTNPRAFGGAPAEVHGLGAFIFPSGVGYERVDLPGPLDKNGKPPRDFLDFFPGEIDIYPAAQAALPAGKRWIAVRLSPTPTGQAARFVAQAEALAPRVWLEKIVWGGTSARSRGAVVVNHVPFSTYDVTVDLRRALASAKSTGDHGARIALEQELAALGGHSVVHFSVWVNGEGNIARLDGVAAGTKLGSIRLDLYSYGVKLQSARPAVRQLVPFASVRGSKVWSSHSPWVFRGV